MYSLLYVSFFFLSCSTAAVVKEYDGTRLIADVKPIAVKKIGVGFEKLFTKDLSESSVTVSFHPRTNEASLDFNYQTNRNMLFLTERARKKIIAATQKYISDFDSRKLNIGLKRNKTRNEYGFDEGRLMWGLFSFNGESRGEILFGYIFVDSKYPYFTIFVPRTENINGQNNDTQADDYSTETVLYFTKSQAAALAEALNQESLTASLDPKDILERKTEKDEYKP